MHRIEPLNKKCLMDDTFRKVPKGSLARDSMRDQFVSLDTANVREVL